MSQPGPDASKRNKKRKLKQSRPLLEQLPAVPALENGQRKQHKNKRHQQQPQHQHGAAAEQQQEQQQQQAAQPDALSAGNSKFARALGSTDFHTREQGLQALSRWLLHRQSTSELDMLKLWKGIYFCFWHSDKEPVQEDLAERLSGLIPRMQPQMAVLYWAAMLSTLRSEWFALDRHRLNKFLMLVRKFVAAVLTRLAAANWDVSTIQSFTSNLPLVGCLIPATNTGRSLGLSYHLADVWLPELRKVVVAGAGSSGSATAPPPAASLQALLEPFVGVMQHSGEAALINRIRESVFEGLVQDLAAAGAAAAAAAGGAGGSSSSSSDEEEEDEDDSSWAYCQLLDVQGYAAALFDRGAEAGVKARNREALYGVSKDLERVAGKRRKAAAAAAAAAAQAPQKQQQPAKKQKQRQQQQEVVAEQDQQQQVEKKVKKQKKQQQQQLEEQQLQEAQAELQQNGTAAEPPGSSAKKRKKQQQQQPPVEAAEQATPGGSAPKHKKHHKQQQEAAAAAGATTTPASGSHKKHGNRHNATTTPHTSSKRGVKIDLKKNIFFEHGSAPPASTPPKAPTPLKSALKSAAVKLDARGRPAAAPGTAPAGAAKQRGSRVVVTPSSVPRLRASEFF